MLTDKHILLIGGDARHLEIIRTLSTLDAKISLAGFEQLDDGFIGASKITLDDVDWTTVDAIILPVSGMSADGWIETVFSNETLSLTHDQLEKTPAHCTIYTGISNDFWISFIKKQKGHLSG